MRSASLLLLLFIFAAGCAPKVEISHILPPKTEVDIRYVDVSKLEGDDLGEFADAMRETLENISRGGERVFYVDENGADGIFSGKITKKSRSAEFFRSDSSDCNENNYCGSAKIRCIKSWYDLDIYIELRSTDDTAKLYSKNFSRGMRTESCPSDPSYDSVQYIGFSADKIKLGGQSAAKDSPSREGENSWEIMQNNIVFEIASDFGDRKANLRVKLAGKDKKLGKYDAKFFKSAVSAAKEGGMEDAYPVWKRLAERYPDAAHLLYNIGVYHESRGEDRQALEYYHRAATLLEGEDKTVKAAIDRMEDKILRFTP